MNPRPDMAAAERILVVRLGAMGDIIHSLPGIAALRQALPQAFIGWAVEERWAELLASRAELSDPSQSCSVARPLVDRIHFVNMKSWVGAPFFPRTWRSMYRAKKDVRAGAYELALDIQGAIKSVIPARWSGAKTIAGYATPREPLAKRFYDETFEMRGVHVVEQGMNLAADLTGAQGLATVFPVPVDHAAEAWRDVELDRRRIYGYAMLTAGAGWGAKRWPAERYGAFAKAMHEFGLQVLVNQSPGEEELAQQVCAASGGTAQAIASNIGQLIALVRRARLFVGGDTGPLHLAAALGVNTVAIYGPTDPARNGPYGAGRIIVLRDPESITSHARKTEPERAMLNISTEDVIDAAKSLLREPADDRTGGGA
jgi:lipopolysaccharide heptosyltransferase I